jgi:hypothetical protein
MKHHTILNCIKVNITCYLILLMTYTGDIKAQILRDFLPIERVLLETILRDTISETFCQLPHGLTFGIDNKSRVNLILLKSGRKNIMLQNGSPYVYTITSTSNEISLTRFDEEIHQGDNFAKLAFLRKDTIFEVGGYGFWKIRDVFSYFDESKKRWKPRRGTDRLPFERFYHYFDVRSDCFYLFGQLLTENKYNINGRTFSDSMFRFSFNSGKWETLGKIEPQQWTTLNDPWDKFSNTFHTPFGLGGNIASILTLRDPKTNQWFSVRDSANIAFRRYNQKIDSVSHNYRIFIHLNDTLHLFLGDTKTFIHEKVRLTRSDFEIKPSGRIYIPIEKKHKGWPNNYVLIGLLGGGSAFIIFLSLRIRRKKSKFLSDDSILISQHATEIPSPSTSFDAAVVAEEQSDADTFLAALSSGEKALVEKLYIATLQGKQMDIDSINKVLGVGRKEVTVQKTRRSTAISKINESWAICLKLKNPLIVRQRNDDDKRSYTYQMADEHLERIGKYLD